jgi:uncharacterized membrane protein YcaP (DUF421 family)
VLDSIWKNFIWLIGGGHEQFEDLSLYQVAARTVVIYLVALVIIRVAKRRFMGGYTSFDVLLGFIVGSIMARAITGSITLVNMVSIVAILVLLHWLIATLTFYFQGIGDLIKNTSRELIIDGKVQEEALRKSKIGLQDLLQALRSEANIESPDEVKAAYLERGGEIRVIPKSKEPRIIEIGIENGVKTIRLVVDSSVK